MSATPPAQPSNATPGRVPTTATPAGNGNGITIPSWILQILPIIALLVGSATVFAQQRADVEQLKVALTELKTIQSQQPQQYVSKQVFDLKMLESEKYQAQLTARLDKIENLINGLYDRLPPKRDQK